jgi:hypothetical protein
MTPPVAKLQRDFDEAMFQIYVLAGNAHSCKAQPTCKLPQ